jgi:hypothetical protein
MLTFAPDLELSTIIDGSLYSIQWQDDEEDNIFDQMAILYNDAQYLYQYFETHADKLKYYKRQAFTPEDAAIRTAKEADALIQEIKQLSVQGLEGGPKSLDDLFERLHSEKVNFHPRYYTDVKAKGYSEDAPWVRVYAVKCDDNLYVITGFGIKLVKDMRDDQFLLLELDKLKKATIYLKKIQMLD